MTLEVGEEATTSSALEIRNTGGCYCSLCAAELEAGQPVVRTKEPGVRRFEFFCPEHSPYPLDGERCRWTAANERSRERRWAARISSCAACGVGMKGYRRDALYCTDACRQRGYRERQELSA